MSAVIYVATGTLEAARQVESLPEGHRGRALHGHHFQITVYACVPAGWAPFPGDESAEIGRRLQICIAPLDYSLLNDRLHQPTDENIGRWVLQNLDVPGVTRVSVQSTPTQGIGLSHRGDIDVWRKYAFQAAHQLPNVPLGHKCGRLHGHSFEVLINVRQYTDQRDLIADYDQLDKCWAPLDAELRYRCLNDIPGLENPTSENISAWLWARLKSLLPHLSSVSVFETNSCGANFDGATYRIWKEITLDSAVRLARAPADSLLHRVHGLTYNLRLHIVAPLDQVLGWTVDFGDVKAIFDPVYRELDHHPLFELEGIEDCDSESVAQWILRKASAAIPQIDQIDLFESHGRGVTINVGDSQFILQV